jgi:hypothetical protein
MSEFEWKFQDDVLRRAAQEQANAFSQFAAYQNLLNAYAYPGQQQTVELAKAKQRIAELESEKAQLQFQIQVLLQRQQPQSQLSPDVVIKLIKLCHPDRHNNSPLANEMTAKLLTMRK